jgi:hypothetical protein
MELRAPRYTDLPFPPYRFRPGRHPHPTAHPNGHSYEPPGAPHHAVAFVEPHQWRDSPEYLYGCDLYNHAYWWEAHEAWEGLWQLTNKTDVQGRFLQALIQVAACHLKLEIGKPEGVRSLRASCAEHARFVLARIGETPYMGLAFAAWRREVDAYYAQRCSAREVFLPHDPVTYPYIVLRD